MKSWRSAILIFLCPVLIIVCSLIIHPVAEIGINDDWSYIKSAELLAQTGHIVYNGWATAMLGWQLFIGAAFVKLFGASFTSVRMATILVALVTALVVQRTFRRAGLSEVNATFGTLVFTLSPLFLVLSLGFMSDIYGLFPIIICIYACLRAIQTERDAASLFWIAIADVSNVVGGTARQIAWLGVLVMVPTVLWMLRKRRRVVELGSILTVVSFVMVLVSVGWFLRQPYSVPEGILQFPITLNKVVHMLTEYLISVLGIILFLLPVLFIFIRRVAGHWKQLAYVAGIWSILCVGFAALFMQLAEHHHISLTSSAIAPPTTNSITPYGLLDASILQGTRRMLYPFSVQAIFVAVALFAAAAFLYSWHHCEKPSQEKMADEHVISLRALLVVLGPFSLAYLALLMPRAAFGVIFDRYLLPILFIVILLILKFYQDGRARRPKILKGDAQRIPRAAWIIQILFMIYAVAGMHDVFAMYRARIQAIDELLAAKVPDTAIDGGFEFNSMTQVRKVGYVNDQRIRVPRQLPPSPKPATLEACPPQMGELAPVVKPQYALAYDPEACEGPSNFAPVSYREWLGMTMQKIYIVKSGLAQEQ